jgi:hypothetical protein
VGLDYDLVSQIKVLIHGELHINLKKINHEFNVFSFIIIKLFIKILIFFFFLYLQILDLLSAAKGVLFSKPHFLIIICANIIIHVVICAYIIPVAGTISKKYMATSVLSVVGFLYSPSENFDFHLDSFLENLENLFVPLYCCNACWQNNFWQRAQVFHNENKSRYSCFLLLGYLYLDCYALFFESCKFPQVLLFHPKLLRTMLQLQEPLTGLLV